MTVRLQNSDSTPLPALESVAPAALSEVKTTATLRQSGARRVRAAGIAVNSGVNSAVNKIAQAKLPHERDESVSTAKAKPSEPMQQAFRDLANGLQDTDRGAEVGRTYKKLKR